MCVSDQHVLCCLCVAALKKGRFWITPDPYHNDDNIQIGREVKISCQVRWKQPWGYGDSSLTHTQAYTHRHTHTDIHTQTYTHMPTHTHTIHKRTHSNTHTNTCPCTHRYSSTNTHTHPLNTLHQQIITSVTHARSDRQ